MQVLDIGNHFEDVSNTWRDRQGCFWFLVHVDELAILKERYALDEESITECRDNKQPSKINFYSHYIFLVFNILGHMDETVRSKELDIFLSKDYIITVYKDPLFMLGDLQKDIHNAKDSLLLKKKPNPAILLYYVIDRIIVRNYNVISELEAHADQIEINILKSPKQDQINELIHLRRQVYKVRKYLNPLRYIGDSIVGNENGVLDRASIIYFKSLNRKIDKLMLALESLVQDLALVREAFESEISNKTNELMKVFTVVTTIFLPLDLIVGTYGMNVKHIPFSEIDYGYYYVMLFMLSLSIMLLIFFKKKKWL